MVHNGYRDGLYLCKVRGLRYCHYMLLRHDEHGWWQYYKDLTKDVEGWIGIGEEIKVIEVIDLIEEDISE